MAGVNRRCGRYTADELGVGEIHPTGQTVSRCRSEEMISSEMNDGEGLSNLGIPRVPRDP